ncbi:MAG: S9 family peptidase [Trueperaceae bacterium]
MTPPRPLPYGTWPSPIDAATVAQASPSLIGARFLGPADAPRIVYAYDRPEQGRTVLAVREPDGSARDIVPEPYDVRSRVYEYGGGAWAVVGDAVVGNASVGDALAFVHFADQRVCLMRPGEDPVQITPASDGSLRYGDLTWDPAHRRLLAVREDHRDAGREPVHTLVAIPLPDDLQATDPQASEAHEGTILVSGPDFVAAPTPSPDGRRFAWIEWEHPAMPWDAARLRVAKVEADGALGPARTLAGGPNEAPQQPRFLPDGSLAFVTDRSGWWTPHLAPPGATDPDQARALTELPQEFGVPAFGLGASTVVPVHDPATDRPALAALFGRGRPSRLAVLALDGAGLREIPLPFRSATDLRAAPDGRSVLLIGGGPKTPDAVVQVDLASGETTTITSAGAPPVDPSWLPEPETIAFPATEGRTAHALLYPPTHPEVAAPDGERPPLIVACHGGPTSAAKRTLNLEVAFWTSRGFAYADVDYGGSSGYGRAYRELLEGRWGEVDVDDACAAATHLAREGHVDPERLAIRGGSAGGFTALAALAFRDTFHAGVSLYGVTDLEGLARETHKFESRYLDRLVGPLPATRDRYRARSPLHNVDRIDAPTLFLQGDQDAVVLPSQSERMVEALRARGVPTEYVLFEGEGHGFRRADTIRRALLAEEAFYRRAFGIDPA